MTREQPSTKVRIGPFLFVFLIPTVLGKALIIYFGLRYSSDPGEGYGWGLLCAIGFTVAMIFSFLWKYRHYSD